jgi:hypothetical protein
LFFFLIFPSKFSPLEALSTGWTTYKEENDGNQSEMLTDIQVDSSQLPLVMNESDDQELMWRVIEIPLCIQVYTVQKQYLTVIINKSISKSTKLRQINLTPEITRYDYNLTIMKSPKPATDTIYINVDNF